MVDVRNAVGTPPQPVVDTRDAPFPSPAGKGGTKAVRRVLPSTFFPRETVQACAGLEAREAAIIAGEVVRIFGQQPGPVVENLGSSML